MVAGPMPNTYDEIQKLYGCGKTPIARQEDNNSNTSMLVEPDSSPLSNIPTIDILEGKPVAKRVMKGKRSTLLSTGNVAHRQRLRKKARTKPPKTRSLNALKKTGHAVGHTIGHTSVAVGKSSAFVAKGLFTVVKGSVGAVRDGTTGGLQWIRGKRGKENGVSEEKIRSEELHKYIYDLHVQRMGYETAEPQYGMQDGRGRRGTWGNLSTLLDVRHAGGEMEEVEEEGLETVNEEEEGEEVQSMIVEKIIEMSPCHSKHELDMDVNDIQSLDSFPHYERVVSRSPTPTKSDSKSTYSQDGVENSLFRLSPKAQRLFHPQLDSTTYYSVVSEEPMKNASMTKDTDLTETSIIAFPHAERDDETDAGSVYSDILPTEGIQRHVSIAPFKDVNDVVEETTTITEAEYEKSIPAIQAWKWDVGFGQGGKTVRERVRDLDFALNSARSLDASGHSGK